MFVIFAEAHKIIGRKMNNEILDIYGIELDEKNLLWGSVLPDIHPKYKFIRHYQDESIEFIAKEIIKIIYIYRNVDFDKISKFEMKSLSKRIGIVSHYLSDYTCLPHAERWTFKDSMVRHIKYESRLNEYALKHDFKKNRIYTNDLDIYETNPRELKASIKEYIEAVVSEEYRVKESYENDLDFALSLNIKLLYFILDTINIYSEEIAGHFAFQI